MKHNRFTVPMSIYKKIEQLLNKNKDLITFFYNIRELAKARRVKSIYEITSKCNLLCEGCYYNEGNSHAPSDEESLDKWKELFKSEAERGVTYGYFVGAEPSLKQERLVVASNYIKKGFVGTNGYVKIDKNIPYRIGVSVWGDEKRSEKARGANIFWDSIKNYAGDPRAMFAYTITSKNIEDIKTVASICKDNGVELTFNMYSPTKSYLKKLYDSSPNNNRYFRISTQKNNLCFSEDDLLRCREMVAKLTEEFPETIVYPSLFNQESSANGSIFDLDENGLPRNCASMHDGTHITYLNNLQVSTAKCCSPNVVCSDCRQVGSYLPARLRPTLKDVSSRENFIDWLEICEYWAWFFIGREHKPQIKQILAQNKEQQGGAAAPSS